MEMMKHADIVKVIEGHAKGKKLELLSTSENMWMPMKNTSLEQVLMAIGNWFQIRVTEDETTKESNENRETKPQD